MLARNHASSAAGDDGPADLKRLAAFGGQPALAGRSFLWPPDDEEVRQALAALAADGGWGRYQGPQGELLGAALAKMHGLQHAWLCSSGTFAVELALRSLKIGPGDEVVLAGYDFPGNFRGIEAVGARPVLVDVEAGGWTIDLQQVSSAIGPRTRAMLVSHMHGQMVDMARVRDLGAKHNLLVVEDACQTPGAAVAGKMAGSWGHVGVLSFGGSKLLTAGRGGALLTDDTEILQRAKIFCERGNNAFPLSELQAAVLLPQLAKLADRNVRRQNSVQRLLQQTADLACLKPLRATNPEARPSYYKVAWLYDGSALNGCSLPQFLAALQAEGLPLDTGFRGFARRGARRCRHVGELPYSAIAAECTLLLHHPVLLESAQTIDAVAGAMRKVVNAFLQDSSS